MDRLSWSLAGIALALNLVILVACRDELPRMFSDLWHFLSSLL